MPGVAYTEFAMFQHADPTKRKLPPLRLLQELGKFFHTMCILCSGKLWPRDPCRLAEITATPTVIAVMPPNFCQRIRDRLFRCRCLLLALI